MRTILMVLAVLAAELATSAAVQAEITYPWCITGSYKGGARSCIFQTFAQCNAGIHIGATYCEPNPLYRPGLDDLSGPRRWRR